MTRILNREIEMLLGTSKLYPTLRIDVTSYCPSQMCIIVTTAPFEVEHISYISTPT